MTSNVEVMVEVKPSAYALTARGRDDYLHFSGEDAYKKVNIAKSDVSHWEARAFQS